MVENVVEKIDQDKSRDISIQEIQDFLKDKKIQEKDHKDLANEIKDNLSQPLEISLKQALKGAYDMWDKDIIAFVRNNTLERYLGLPILPNLNQPITKNTPSSTPYIKNMENAVKKESIDITSRLSDSYKDNIDKVMKWASTNPKFIEIKKSLDFDAQIYENHHTTDTNDFSYRWSYVSPIDAIIRASDGAWDMSWWLTAQQKIELRRQNNEAKLFTYAVQLYIEEQSKELEKIQKSVGLDDAAFKDVDTRYQAYISLCQQSPLKEWFAVLGKLQPKIAEFQKKIDAITPKEYKNKELQKKDENDYKKYVEEVNAYKDDMLEMDVTTVPPEDQKLSVQEYLKKKIDQKMIALKDKSWNTKGIERFEKYLKSYNTIYSVYEKDIITYSNVSKQIGDATKNINRKGFDTYERYAKEWSVYFKNISKIQENLKWALSDKSKFGLMIEKSQNDQLYTKSLDSWFASLPALGKIWYNFFSSVQNVFVWAVKWIGDMRRAAFSATWLLSADYVKSGMSIRAETFDPIMVKQATPSQKAIFGEWSIDFDLDGLLDGSWSPSMDFSKMDFNVSNVSSQLWTSLGNMLLIILWWKVMGWGWMWAMKMGMLTTLWPNFNAYIQAWFDPQEACSAAIFQSTASSALEMVNP